MSIDAPHILSAVVIGVGATVAIDLWSQFLRRAFGIPSLSYCLLGRWLRHMPGGTFRHVSIVAAPQKPFECMVGWMAHYTIGIVLVKLGTFPVSLFRRGLRRACLASAIR